MTSDACCIVSHVDWGTWGHFQRKHRSPVLQQAGGAKLCVEDWEYYIGGYQVIKKWLSYQEKQVLGRSLRPEARYVTEMVRRIAAILLLQPRLDENYQRIKQNTFDWSNVKVDEQ